MIELYSVSKIEENPWNPNQMPADKYEALREDMKRGGPVAIDPILTASKRAVFKDPSIPEDVRITMNGNHRLRLARELGWRKIREDFDPTIDSEGKARVIGYRKNVERGEMDPYKLPEYFKWFVDQEWTHEQIAKEHSVDRTTVTKHLSVLKISPDVKEKLASVPRVTISHLEPIATLKPKQQRQLASEIAKDFKREPPSVKHIEHKVRWIKEQEIREIEERRRAEKLRKAVEKSKFQKCPICGKPPLNVTYEGLPKVRCEGYHEWNLKTGKMPAYQERRAKPKKPEFPKYLRTAHTVDDFRRVFAEYAKSKIPLFTRVDDLECRGRTFAKGEARIRADLDGSSASLAVHIDGTDFYLTVEPKTYKIGDLKKFKTSVRIYPEPKRKADLVKLEQLVSQIFKEFGGKARD